jgi:hypothetical protein
MLLLCARASAAGGIAAGYAAVMAYSSAEAAQYLLDSVAGAADELGIALAYLGEAYEQLDELLAERLEDELFRPVQTAYGRAQRVHAGFAERRGLPGHAFQAAAPHVREHDARGIIERAVAAVERADSTLATLQDSMLPVEVGDAPLRAGLEQVRVLLGEIRERARDITRRLGR